MKLSREIERERERERAREREIYIQTDREAESCRRCFRIFSTSLLLLYPEKWKSFSTYALIKGMINVTFYN